MGRCRDGESRQRIGGGRKSFFCGPLPLLAPLGMSGVKQRVGGGAGGLTTFKACPWGWGRVPEEERKHDLGSEAWILTFLPSQTL